jgi:HAD superfamily hydrolase (TIGR01509 family)
MTNIAQIGVLWDVDGTLVDTAELHFQAWVKLAHEIQAPFTRDDFAATFGWRNPEIIPKLFGVDSPDEVDALGRRKEDYYRTEAAKGLDLLPGVAELVRNLEAAGVGQAVGSSAPRANIELILDMCGLRAILKDVVAMEDTTRGKPDPQVFLLGAAKLGIEPRLCVVFEDAPVGIRAAKAAGMKAVGVTFVGHHPVDKLKSEGADLVVLSLAEVGVDTVRRLFDRG